MPAQGAATGRPITGGLRPRAGGCAADGRWAELLAAASRVARSGPASRRDGAVKHPA